MLLLATQVAGGMKGAALCSGAKTRWSGACARSKPKAAAYPRPYELYTYRTVAVARQAAAGRKPKHRAGLIAEFMRLHCGNKVFFFRWPAVSRAFAAHVAGRPIFINQQKSSVDSSLHPLPKAPSAQMSGPGKVVAGLAS
jgi:hypothetical protein